MNRIGVALLLLLLAQLVLIAQLYQPEHSTDASTGGRSLADTGPFLVDEIHIADSRDTKTVLTREAERWILPQHGSLPADANRIKNLLEQLTATDPGWPVAHTLPARQRFQVAPYHFRRRIELWAQGQNISTVYIGTSPGFRKVHARNVEDDEIYSISLNLYETSANAGRWLDSTLLQPRGLVRIASDDYSLDRSGGTWLASNGHQPDGRELDALLAALRGLQVTGLASEEERDELLFAEATLILHLESLGGTTSLEFYALGERRYVISSEYDEAFTLSAYSFDQLTGIDGPLLSGAQ